MIGLTEKDKNKLRKGNYNYHDVRKFTLRSGSYYVKDCYEDEALRELIGKKVFDMVRIKCPEYEDLIADRRLISKDLNHLRKFIYIEDLPEISKDICWRPITLDVVREAILNEVRNKEEILLQINIMHFIDILFSNIDRHIGNYGMFFDKNRNGYLAVFDNGLFISDLGSVTRPVSLTNISGSNPKGQECEHFLENLPLEHKKIMYELFLKFTPNLLKEIIDSIENEYKYKFKFRKKLIKDYKKNYLMVYSIIRKSIEQELQKEVKREMKLNKSL